MSARGAYQRRKSQINDQLVLDALIDWREEKGHSPTIRELATDTGLSISAVLTCLERLEDAGAVESARAKARPLVPLRIEAYPVEEVRA